MKAVYKVRDGHDGWEVRDIDRKEPGPGEVELQVMAIGICGSELHLYHDNHFYTPPALIGHEWSAKIIKVGPDVTEWKVGDRVVMDTTHDACGHCYYCSIGQPLFCPVKAPYGPYGNKDGGGWREYFTVKANGFTRIPDNVSFEEAAMLEPVTVLTQALGVKCPVKLGETVLVQGAGSIGILAAQVAKAAGAGKVILTDVTSAEEVKLSVARKIPSIDVVLDVQKNDLMEYVQKETNGLGIDLVVECSGSPKAINDTFKMIRRGGRMMVIGEPPTEEINVRWIDAIVKNIDMITTFGSTPEAWRMAMTMIQTGRVVVKPLISHRIGLLDWEKGFKLMDDKKALKVIMFPHGEDAAK